MASSMGKSYVTQSCDSHMHYTCESQHLYSDTDSDTVSGRRGLTSRCHAAMQVLTTSMTSCPDVIMSV